MKTNLFFLSLLFLTASCNNAGSDSGKSTNDSLSATKQTVTNTNPVTLTSPSSGTTVTVEGKEIKLGGSLLVTKDKDKLQPGDDYLCILTAPGGLNKENMFLNFLLALKPGTYPIVGMSFRRGKSPNNEMYGAMLYAKSKMTNYKVNITECRDLGSNNNGGHRWSISGNFEGLVIPAMDLMLLDKTKKHPKEIKIDKGSFKNLSFDDNMEDLMQQGMKKMQRNK